MGEEFVRAERTMADIWVIVGQRRARSLGTALPYSISRNV
jgi:protein-S-isoprenylcysteine O-methyltransferase Ste14